LGERSGVEQKGGKRNTRKRYPWGGPLKKPGTKTLELYIKPTVKYGKWKGKNLIPRKRQRSRQAQVPTNSLRKIQGV